MLRAHSLARTSTRVCLTSSLCHGEKECESSTSADKLTLQPSEVTLSESELVLPEEPTTCCMSGCANCVWIEYADQVCKMFESGEKAREIVLSKVTDPNMKAFLLMELRALENSKNDKTS